MKQQTDSATKRPIMDLLYSFTAYVLPTFMLQFIILPLIAMRLSPEKNGLFLTLFNTIRLCVSMFIAPLANIRLLKKKECIAKPHYDKEYNFLFLLVTGISGTIVIVLGMYYCNGDLGFHEIIRLVAVLILLCAHDYYSISFRIEIRYKYILIDNLMIVLGYIFGIGLMLKYGYWELVFISGYSFGLLYTMVKSKLWRKGVKPYAEKGIITEFSQLSASSGLNNATTYCDKMLIYPLIGGYSVSVYNAASVVSKVMSLISIPLRNVFLSYIVDKDSVTLSNKKHNKIICVVLCGSLVIYGGFYCASIFLCKMLYAQYFDAALHFIPIILLAILVETYSGLIKVYLLRFERVIIQTIAASIKLFLYLLCILVLTKVWDLGLLGFCISILIADCVHFCMVLFWFIKSVKR